MKTIIYAGPFQLPDKNAAAHRVLNNAKIFRAYGFHVVFVGLNPEANDEFAQTHYTYADFDIYEVKASGSFEKFKAFASHEWMSYLTEQYDVAAIIAYDYYAYSLRSLFAFFRNRPVSIIMDTDEWFIGTGKSLLEKIIRKADSELRMRVFQPKADAVIAISRFLTEYYEKKTCTVTVPPLVDKTESKWSDSTPTETGILNLVYSGSPGMAKDKLGLLVRFISQVEKDYEIRFTIIGVTENDFLFTHPESVHDLKNSLNEIVFLGRIPHKEALKLLTDSDFSVFFREVNRVSTAGFPTKFVESISAGVPVITNRTSDLECYLTDGENGFLLDDDWEMGLQRVFDTELSKLKSMRKNVKSDLFHYENHVHRMEKIVSLIRKNNNV